MSYIYSPIYWQLIVIKIKELYVYLKKYKLLSIRRRLDESITSIKKS